MIKNNSQTEIRYSDLPVYEIQIDDEGNQGIRMISLVADPAISVMGMYFSSDIEQEFRFKSVKEQQIIVGPAMLTEKKILRKDNNDNYYYVYFTKETIYNCAHLFLKKHLQDAHSIEHQTPIEGCTVVESWLIEDSQKDKAAHFGLNFPAGTWMLGTHVREDNVWEAVKAGEITGFSIEGRFDHIKLSKQTGDPGAEFLDSLEKILGEIGKK